MTYRRSGRSGLKLPELSLGLWQNFGHTRPLDACRAIMRRAFDLGITHFDLANNYGPPYGSAEETFGRIMASDLAPYRDELIVSTKAVRRPGVAQVRSPYLSAEQMTQETLANVPALGAIATRRGQPLAEMALAWTLRDARVTSAIIGVSSVSQLEDNLGALNNSQFSASEQEEIDRAVMPRAFTRAD